MTLNPRDIAQVLMDDTEPAEQSHDEVLMTAVLFETALALLALFLGWALGPSARAMVPTLEVANVWPICSGLLYGCAAAIPMLIAVELMRKIPWEKIRELERLTDDGIFKLLMELRASELILISICAGVGEELLFRGWLLYWILAGVGEQATASPAMLGLAVVASSLVFGLFHPITPLYVVIATLMGFYFGMLMILSGNLLVPIAAHATYDAVQLIMTARQQASAEPVGES